jgi:hypothetical protein
MSIRDLIKSNPNSMSMAFYMISAVSYNLFPFAFLFIYISEHMQAALACMFESLTTLR